MKSIKNILWACGIAGVFSAGFAAGCSSDPETTPTPTGSGGAGGAGGEGVTSSTGGGKGGEGGGQGGAGGEGGAGGQGGQGGAGGSSAECAIKSDGPVLAINKLYFGDTNPDDTPNKLNGWKQYGFNVDGLVSTAMSVDLCKPKQGGQPSNTYPDGDNGIDNSFGKNVMPVLNAGAPDFAASVNEAIATGKFTLIGHLEGLGPDPDMPSLTSRFYTGAALGDNPKFDGTDCWPVAQESLTDPAAIESAKVLFDKSSVTSNMWSSGGNTTLELSLPSAAFGVPIKLTIYQARLSMILDPDHGGALGGQIGGVLDTEEVAAEVKKVAGSLDPSLCSGPTTEAILTQIRQASDIMKDGTQDPAQECDGISIGLGFKMEQIGLSYIEQPAPPSPDPCAP